MEKKQKEEKVKKSFFKKIKILLSIIILVAIGVVVASFFFYEKQEKVSNEIVTATLEQESELTTAKLNYKGFAKYNEEYIPMKEEEEPEFTEGEIIEEDTAESEEE